MPDVSVLGFVLWRSADDNPPSGDSHRRLFAFTRRGEPCLPEAGAVARRPDEYTVWCDPSPPDMSDELGPLTVAHLELAHDAIVSQMGRIRKQSTWRAYASARDHLRRAIDALRNEGRTP